MTPEDSVARATTGVVDRVDKHNIDFLFKKIDI